MLSITLLTNFLIVSLLSYGAFLALKQGLAFYDVCRRLRKTTSLDKPNFIFGNILQLSGLFIRDQNVPMYQHFVKAIENYYDKLRCHGICTVWLAWSPYIALLNAASVQEALSNTKLENKSDEYKFLEPWLSTGLLTSGAKKWKRRRKMLTPTFHFQILEKYYPVMVKHSQTLTEKLGKENGQFVDTLQFVSLATLDTICETAMGINIEAQKNPSSDYVQAVNFCSESTFERFLQPQYWNDVIFYRTGFGSKYRKSVDYMHRFSTKIIQNRKYEILSKRLNGDQSRDDNDNTELELGRKKREAFMDLLIEQHLSSLNPNGDFDFTIEDIREEVDTFMFEGFETTAIAISWTLHLLANSPECQTKAYQEVVDIVGNESQITLGHIKEMKYLECCIKEALRLFPSVPIIARKLEEDTVIQGYDVPKGVGVIVYIKGIQNDPNLFPEPRKYRPERFLDETLAKNSLFGFVPFSAGSRNCIGQKFAMLESKTYVASVIRQFSLEAQKPTSDIKYGVEIILRPKEPLFIKFTPRKDIVN